MPIIAVQKQADAGGGGVPSGQTINPIMVSENDPAPHLLVASWYEGATWAPHMAFNHNNNDLGWAGRPVNNEIWIAYKHNAQVVVNQTRITSLHQGSSWRCNAYEVYGTNDDFTDIASTNAANWILLDTVSCPGLAAGVWSEYFPFTNATAYSGYKLRVTSWGSKGAQIQEIEFVAA